MLTVKRSALPWLAAVLASAIACGGSDRSPVSPSPSEGGVGGPSPAAGGATVSGTVAAGSAAQVLALGSVSALGGVNGVRVTVAGTDLSTTTASSGAFSLHGVPPGRVLLNFQGSGVAGTLELSDVSAAEDIDLVLVVNGSTVELESQERVTGSQAQLEGKVLSADYAARRFVVGTTNLVVPEGVPITNGYRALALTDVIVGARLHAKGTQAGDTLTATQVMVQQTGLERVSVSGVLSDLQGACPETTFRFGSLVLGVNASTIFVGGTCADLKSGAELDVKGFRRTDGSVLATMVKFKKAGDDDGDDDGVPVELNGPIAELSGPCPARSFTVGARKVRTTGATVFLTACETLVNGQVVRVKGKATGNGMVIASEVQ